MSRLSRLCSSWLSGESTRSTPAASQPRPSALLAFAATHSGRVRSENEDTVELRELGKATPDAPAESVLAILADGMGGSNAGEVASRKACDVLLRTLLDDDTHFRRAGDPSHQLSEAFRLANREIFRQAAAQPAMRGMGTTCVALVVREGLAWMAYVGDSRLYLARAGQIYRMSEDHSVVFELVKRGVLTVEAAHDHPDRNILSRALGTRAAVEVSAWQKPIALFPGDRFLLCSDGLHDLVPDQDLLAATQSRRPKEAATLLIELANQRGGFDNISAIVIEVLNAAGQPVDPIEETTAAAKLPDTREFVQA